jgi:membrane protein insertase Oxa1/YidC/SpoIIIJ
MGVFFFLQTKLTTAPATTDQQRQQQRIMSIMMVTVFPLMLYAAPSGLTLYIMSSSLAGMIDSLVVRKHIKQMEADGTLFENKKLKTGGFMERFRAAIEQRRNMITEPKKPKRRKPRN